MKKLSVVISSLLLLPLVSRAQPKIEPPAKVLVFTRVSVIGTEHGHVLPDRTVVILNERIVAMGETSKVSMPKDAHVVNATGKFLVPGFWDMHTHIVGKEFLSLFLANGVTGVREMANYPDQIFRWRIADEAKKQGLPFAGHVPIAIGAAEASDAGQKSIEHLTGLLIACASNSEELRKEAMTALTHLHLFITTAGGW